MYIICLTYRIQSKFKQFNEEFPTEFPTLNINPHRREEHYVQYSPLIKILNGN